MIMQIKEEIESFLKVFLTNNSPEWFSKLWQESSCHISRGGDENPLYFRKVMHCMHLECDL
jgi:hypothetical protein